VTENKSDMLNDKAIAQCTNSGGMIVCEYLQVPGALQLGREMEMAERRGG